jgi:bifunctional non-homologous end joining protein LigD
VVTLKKYKAKRTFSETPEPSGGVPSSPELRFVVQKHAASHLHYDFRLELGGVLKSWAVPKGPSMDPSIKRLAMMVEDHPFDYRSFEGIIPKGNYGAGTVMVWDEGFYEPVGDNAGDKKAKEKYLRHQLYSGKLKFYLNGKKLKGQFALVKANQRGENSWLLMKLNDKYGTDKDVLLKDKSVVSRKTIESIARTSKKIYGRPENNASRRMIKKALRNHQKS